MGLRGATALAAVGCGSVTVVKVNAARVDAGCARFPKGSAWSFDGVLPGPTTNAAGASVHGLDFDKFASK